MANEVAAKKAKNTMIMQVQDTYTRMIENQFIENRLPLSQYSKECIINALSSIQNLFEKNQISFSSPEIDQSSLTTALRQVAALQLNAAVTPREVYFQIRREKRADGTWIKKIEVGIEGDGNDRLLRNFGYKVNRVGTPWLVRDNDEFTFPIYTGFDVTPPVWRPTGSGKIIRVVYPVELTDGKCEYLIQERDDVRPNLIAHIANGLMNETFGMAKSRYDADTATKAKIDTEKRRILDMLKTLTMEQILDEPSLQGFISPAWSEPQSREQMIVRKMRNNAVKKYPKDFGSQLIAEAYSETDETYTNAQIEANTGAVTAVDISDIQGEAPAAGPEPVAAPVQQEPGEQVPITGPGF